MSILILDFGLGNWEIEKRLRYANKFPNFPIQNFKIILAEFDHSTYQEEYKSQHAYTDPDDQDNAKYFKIGI